MAFQRNTAPLVASDFLGLHSWTMRPEGVCQAVLVLIHGMGEHSERYVHVAEFFASHGIAVVSMDLRGHGRSGGKRGHAPSLDQLMQDIRKLTEKAEKEFPGIPLFLYGHSMGGNLALNYILRTPGHPYTKLVLTSPYLKLAFNPPGWKLALGKIAASVYPSLSQPTGLDVTAISRDVNEVEKYKKDPLVHGKITAGFFAQIHPAAAWALANAGSLKIPTLVVHGSMDRITSPEGSKQLAENAGAMVQVKIWEGLFHETHNEPEKNEVLAFTLNWLMH